MSRWSAIERELRAAGAVHICGMDEVGRGPFAGPVVVCAVIMPAGARAIAGVADSKRLRAEERERLAHLIHRKAVAVALGAASVREVEALNIYHATTRAMQRALKRLSVSPDALLVDGKPIQALGVAHQGVIGGDDRCYAIACASIVAKVTRDRLMARLARRYPGYGWERNAGYGTAEHLGALRARGPTPHHRRGWGG